MGYGQKVKKWFFEEEDDEDDVYEDVQIDNEEEAVKSTSMFEKAKSTKTSDAVKALSANKDSHLVLFEPRAYSETQEIAIYLKQKRAHISNITVEKKKVNR